MLTIKEVIEAQRVALNIRQVSSDSVRQAAISLLVYKRREEYDGSLKSAIDCLEMDEYEIEHEVEHD